MGTLYDPPRDGRTPETGRTSRSFGEVDFLYSTSVTPETPPVVPPVPSWTKSTGARVPVESQLSVSDFCPGSPSRDVLRNPRVVRDSDPNHSDFGFSRPLHRRKHTSRSRAPRPHVTKVTCSSFDSVSPSP